MTAPRRVALVTGASRGIGAEVARILGRRGLDIVVHYRTKQRRAEEVANAINSGGARAITVSADLTSDMDRSRLLRTVSDHFGRLDILVLNASGGLERNVPADYAIRLNRDAQIALVDDALALMPPGSRVVLVTSHFAHFYDTKPVYPAYEPVAASKFAGEQALRARIDDLAKQGISLVVVSGDLIEGTITPRLLERAQPGLIETRRGQATRLPTVTESARAIADAVLDESLTTGHTVYVGSTG